MTSNSNTVSGSHTKTPRLLLCDYAASLVSFVRVLVVRHSFDERVVGRQVLHEGDGVRTVGRHLLVRGSRATVTNSIVASSTCPADSELGLGCRRELGFCGGTDDEDHSLMSAACSLPSSADPAPSSGSPYRTCPEPSWLRPEEKQEDVGTSQR